MNVAFAVVVVLLAWSVCIDAWFGGGGGSKSGGNKGGSKGGNKGGNNGGKKGGTTADVGVEASKDGGVGVSAGVSHQGDGWSGGIKGSANSKGDWGVKAGVSVKFRKRSTDLNGRHYNVLVRADPCNFKVYDGNRDGVIDKSEMYAIFEDSTQAEQLFDALDLTTGDGQIKKEEFYIMSRIIIEGCDLTDGL